MQQFFIADLLTVGKQIPFPEEVERQLRQVLRVRGGEVVRLIDAQGHPFLARLAVTKKKVEAVCLEMLQETHELPTTLILAPARIKKDKWEWMLQKATELGVSAIWPLVTERVNEVEPTPNRLIRWRRILQEAAEQCERHRLPVLRDAQTLEELLLTVEDEENLHVIVLAERREDMAPPLGQALQEIPPGKAILLVVGPEGGFSADEFSLLANAGWTFASLGPRILRAETAAVLSAGMAAQWLETSAKEA